MQNSFNWNQIYLEFSPKLLGVCRRYIEDLAIAEDILQDSFLTAIQKEEQLKNSESVYPWLKKIVVNNSLMYLRSNHQRHFTVSDTEILQQIPTTMTNSWNEDYHTVLGYDFTQEELLSSIDQLAPHHKSVFNLYYLENYSHAQISETLGINVNTSKSHLLRAKKSIQQFLTQKTEGKKSSELKRTGFKILSLIGFSNLLWGHTFRTKFQNFTVTPQKPFSISPENANTVFKTLEKSKSNWLAKSLGILALFLGFVYVGIQQKNPEFFHSFTDEKKPAEIKETPAIKTAENNTKINKIPKESTTPNPVVSDPEIKPVLVTKNAFPVLESKDNIESKKIIPLKKKEKIASKKAIVKDTATENQKKQVIIVKKIIKRDTVFIER